MEEGQAAQGAPSVTAGRRDCRLDLEANVQEQQLKVPHPFPMRPYQACNDLRGLPCA